MKFDDTYNDDKKAILGLSFPLIIGVALIFFIFKYTPKS